MHLTDRTDYGLRVLLFLAQRPSPRPRPARVLAEAFSVSESHLAKVIQALAACGYVRTVPGRGGGVVLAADPQELTLGAVVRALEPMTIAPCFGGDTTCPYVGRCGLAGVLDDAQQAFLHVLDGKTLHQAVQATGPQAG